MSEETGDIRFERRGRLGVAILDRQAALNALTHAMIRALSRQLAAWRDDPAIAAVLVKAAPGRAFCAGGDIRHIMELARDHGVEAAVPFFRDEYRLNWRVHSYPKPYIALLDGITMGGGVGISVHGGFRVVTESTLFAMPETGIGFFPDVGGTWFLPRCPGEIGIYLGLTGSRLGAADCLLAGIGTHYVRRERLGELEAMLVERLDGGDARAVVEDALERLGRAEEAGEGTLSERCERIDRCYAAASVADLVRRLEEDTTGFGADQLAVLSGKSPFAVHATFAQLRRGRGLDIAACLRLEYRMVHRFLAGHDFIEGVRALIVDKDRRPRWQHRSLVDVPAAAIEACMAPLPGGDLALDWQGV